jgi:hypothetical protein
MIIIEGSFLPIASALQPEAYSASNGAFALIQSTRRFYVWGFLTFSYGG